VSRATLIAFALVIVAGAGFGASFFVIRSNLQATPLTSEEQRIIRKNFFGLGKELPLIGGAQEMRPRW
jgi:Ti type entry exclusion protein TrbK